jgi:hypothetical protein
MDKKAYFGPFLVESVTPVEGFLTNAGKPIVLVRLVNGFEQKMPQLAYEEMKSDSPEKDLTNFTDRYLDKVAAKVLAVLAEQHLTGESVDRLFQIVSGNLVESFNRAAHKALAGDNCLYTPRGNALNERSITEVEYMLRGDETEQNDN